jgi:hypothetical protein
MNIPGESEPSAEGQSTRGHVLFRVFDRENPRGSWDASITGAKYPGGFGALFFYPSLARVVHVHTL